MLSYAELLAERGERLLTSWAYQVNSCGSTARSVKHLPDAFFRVCSIVVFILLDDFGKNCESEDLEAHLEHLESRRTQNLYNKMKTS